MTHHDDHWGILGSQQDEDQSRAKAVNDPAEYPRIDCGEELHWFDPKQGQWVAKDASGDWQGWNSATAEKRRSTLRRTPWSAALDSTAAPFYRWFVDGQTNACFNLLDRHVLSGRGDKQAVVFERRPLGPPRMMAEAAPYLSNVSAIASS